MSTTPKDSAGDRLDAWYDGSAICVVAVAGAACDPLDLADHEVIDFVAKLNSCLAESQSSESKLVSNNQQADRSTLAESWARTLRHIAASRFYLPEALETKEALSAEREYAHYLHHNELGLALEAIEALGEIQSSPPAFWHELELAAKSMGMHEAATRYALRRGA
jgi:hypothetical protein